MSISSWFLIERSASGPTRKAWFFSLALVLGIFSLVCWAVIFSGSRSWQWAEVWNYRAVFFKGWLVTLGMTAWCLAGSLVIGSLMAAAQLSRIILIRAAVSVLVSVFRGTPLLVQILFFFYVIADGIGLENRYLVGALSLSFYAGTYIAEILRGGLESIGRAQRMAAKAVGMTAMQAYRYIILPQAFRAVLPALAGQLVALVKHSSLLSIIAVEEFTYAAKTVNATTFSTLESYLPLLLGYLLLTLPVSAISLWIHQTMKYEN